MARLLPKKKWSSWIHWLYERLSPNQRWTQTFPIATVLNHFIKIRRPCVVKPYLWISRLEYVNAPEWIALPALPTPSVQNFPNSLFSASRVSTFVNSVKTLFYALTSLRGVWNIASLCFESRCGKTLGMIYWDRFSPFLFHRCAQQRFLRGLFVE